MKIKAVWLTVLWIISTTSLHRAAAFQAAAGASDIPPGSVFTPPKENACQSKYDQFYIAEPGVYVYWGFCEAGTPVPLYDYVGQYDLTSSAHSFGAGGVTGGAEGPVNDGETAASVKTASYGIANQGLPLNTHQGTVSAWINADAPNYPVPAVLLPAVKGKSIVALRAGKTNNEICFSGLYTNDAAAAATVQKCGYTPNTWHRVAFTWSQGTLNLYVDGVPVATGKYEGSLDNKVFFYKLFPGCCQSTTQMTLAKISISHLAWSPAQVAADFAPQFPKIPEGGVFVGSQKLGTIHKDVLGFAGLSPNTSTPQVRNSLLSGLKETGVTSLRYAEGQGGIDADLQDWQGRGACTKTQGAAGKVASTASKPGPDDYIEGIAKPLKLSIVYTVNYGTNPPACNAGGDPEVNGASLVRYANRTRGYGIKYWEIGNEVYSNYSETDFHDQPNSGDSYAKYEPAFYKAMKAEDPSIKIGVPVSLSIYSYQAGFSLPVFNGASYDAVIFHNYPVHDPITDGATLYQDRVASNTSRLRGGLLAIQTALLNAGKSADSIWVTEWDGEQAGNMWSKQTIGAVTPLFVTSQLAEYMQAGVQVASWFAQGSPNVCSTFNYDYKGETAYSWWKCGIPALVFTGSVPNKGEVAIGIHPGDLYPAGRAFQLISQSGFVTEGEHMLRTQTDLQKAPWLLSYAATHGSSYAVILINRDRDEAHTVPIAFANKAAGRSVQQWTYGRAQYDKTRQGDWSAAPLSSKHGPWNSNFTATLPPWSVNVFVFDN
jgi:Concanavalin A-like lectin/glucanases superfamily